MSEEDKGGMSNMSDNQAGQVSRRSFLSRAGAVSAAGVVAAGVVNPAAAFAGNKLRTYKGKYAIDTHRVIDGFMASPKGKTDLDVVVVVSESGKLDAAAEATARRYAASGWIAIAPDLAATYGKAGDKQAMVAALTRDLPRLKRLSRSSGKVAVVAA